MSTETEPGALESSRHRRVPQLLNTVNTGQIYQIITILLTVGSAVIYQRSETEVIRREAAVQKVQVEALSSNIIEDKARVQRENAEQKQALTQNLTKIEGKVDAVTVVVQQLSTQIAISQGLQQGNTARRP